MRVSRKKLPCIPCATGMISILHTWGQTLSLHPHLHCIVPGGGLSGQGKWKTAKSKGKYLFPVKAMSRVFRAKYIQLLKAKDLPVERELLNQLFQKEWVVFAKRPFGNPQSVVEYLGRYTHKIALSNHRIKGMDQNSVTFSYKDYRHSAQKKEMTLEAMEFIRRFSMHILPKGFVRIRHYGILSSSTKKTTIPVIRNQLSQQVSVLPEPRILKPYNAKTCPYCKTETMITLEILTKRGPPSPAQLLQTVHLKK